MGGGCASGLGGGGGGGMGGGKRDSNPRMVAHLQFSRLSLSTTQPFPHILRYSLKVHCLGFGPRTYRLRGDCSTVELAMLIYVS